MPYTPLHSSRRKFFGGVKFVTLMTWAELLVNDDILHQSVRQIFYIASLSAITMSDSDHAYFAQFLSFFVGIYVGYILAVERVL